MAEVKKEKVRIVTPLGRISFPSIVKPDEGRQYSDGKYKADLIIDKGVFKLQGAALREAVLKVAQEGFGKKLELSAFKNPFHDCDKKDGCPEFMKNSVQIRAKSTYAPLIVDANKKEMSMEDREKIKGGDYCRFLVTVFHYSQSSGGVSLALNVVQFVKSGEAFGSGKDAMLSMIDEIEVTPEDGLEELDSDMKF